MATRVSRFRLPLAVLLVLFGVSAAVAPSTGEPASDRHGVTVVAGTATGEPSAYEDLRDWLRFSAGSLRTPATALPDTWWTLGAAGTDGCARAGHRLTGGHEPAAIAGTTPTPRSSRAPPPA